MRIVLPLAVAAVATVSACTTSSGGPAATYSGAFAPVVPVAMIFTPDNDESEAAVFEDDDLGIDVIQIYAYEDSS